MFFFKKYSILADYDYQQTLDIFKHNLDDMAKKGYSMSRAIINEDHNGRLFSGEYKNDCFVVRQTESASDFNYRYLPKHKISFESCEGKTKVNVQSCANFLFVVFSVVFVAFLIMAGITVLMVLDGEIVLPVILAVVVTAVVSLITAVVSYKQIENTKITLQYLYR